MNVEPTYVFFRTLASRSYGTRVKKKNDSPAASGSGEPHQNLYANPTKHKLFSYNHGFKMSYEALRRHLDTPRRAKVQGAVEFLRAKGIKIKNEAIFEHFNVSTITDYRLLRTFSRTRHNQDINETRGRKSKISGEQMTEADKILQEIELQLDGKRLTWEQLATEVAAEVTGRIMHRIMKLALNYEKCKACVTG